jgi:hypothetical protein
MIKTFSTVESRSPLLASPRPLSDSPAPVSLRLRLTALPFAAFARFVADVLAASGYENVQARGRNRFLGKNANGGVDLTATLPGSLGVRPVIAQLKQLAPDTTVSQRYVDELRGVCLRTGAAEALLITSGTFSPLARENATRTAHSPVAPVRLLDGESLVRLAVQHRVGIVKDDTGKTAVDAAYFSRLKAQFPAAETRTRRAAVMKVPATLPSAPPPVVPPPKFVRNLDGPVTVTVTIQEDYPTKPAGTSDRPSPCAR